MLADGHGCEVVNKADLSFSSENLFVTRRKAGLNPVAVMFC